MFAAKNLVTPAKAGAHGRHGSRLSPTEQVCGLKAHGKTRTGGLHWMVGMNQNESEH